jgi:hypothetical protein
VAINTLLVKRNWCLGKRIAEEELHGEDRAKYGAQLIKQLSKDLTKRYGKGFNASNLYHYVMFYKYFPNIFYSVSRKSEKENFYSVSRESQLLTWTHYRALLYVDDDEARAWYAKEAFDQTWSLRTLQRMQ